ncbi:C-type mannose receptor 2-like isoform X2 [Ictalurus furcatus]|uniref:C-type mannose receptor 2-like isoform X2 n=1 Tax=Ictalurus furcatus TaxID=66913 RepID=UPI0023502FEA|nr:C-type mannose receptor 2-like isoform X2 [Ictalurus furcatus]
MESSTEKKWDEKNKKIFVKVKLILRYREGGTQQTPDRDTLQTPVRDTLQTPDRDTLQTPDRDTQTTAPSHQSLTVMGSAVNFIPLFSGLWALALCASRQFYVVNTPMTWTDAQKYCRAKYTDLATIANDEEMNAVKEALNGSTEHFWIGLRQTDSNSSIVFNSRSWVWSDNSQVSYWYWNNNEPNNDGIDNCVEIWEASANNKWNDAGCNNTVHFVCYKKRTPLTVITEKKTWREALRYCRQHHVDLVSVDSQEMQDWVGNVTKNLSSDMWIGLRHTCALGFWYWVKGEMICYQNWAPGNGTGVEDCGDVERTGAVLSESKKWVSLPQTHELYFICVTFQ